MRIANAIGGDRGVDCVGGGPTGSASRSLPDYDDTVKVAQTSRDW